MATGIPFDFPNCSEKFMNAPMQNSTVDYEVTHDLHAKMSKKIAQLTKVICALNTKNDEQEMALSQLQMAHRDEIEHVNATFDNKLQDYYAKCTEMKMLKDEITRLEALTREQEQVRRKAQVEMERLRSHYEKQEQKLQREHSEKLIDLSQEVLKTKQEFEEQLKRYQQLQREWEEERKNTVLDLKESHRREIDELLFQQLEDNKDISNQWRKLEAIYRDQLSEFEAKCDKLQTERDNALEEGKVAQEEGDAKLAKMKAFYESEMKTFEESVRTERSKHLSVMEQDSVAAQKREKEVRQAMEQQEKELNDQLENVVKQLSESEMDVTELRIERSQLQVIVQDLEQEKSAVTKQLKELSDKKEELECRLAETQNQFTEMLQKCTQLDNDLMNKNSFVGELEASSSKDKAVIGQLQDVLDKTRDKLAWSEEQLKCLKSQNEADVAHWTQQMNVLEQSIDDMAKQKVALLESHSNQLDELQTSCGDKIKLLQEEAERVKKELEDRHSNELDELQKHWNDKLNRQREELTRKHESVLRDEREVLGLEIDNLKLEASLKERGSEEKVAQLERHLDHRNEELLISIENLRNRNNRLEGEQVIMKEQLEACKQHLTEARHKNDLLHCQIKTLKSNQEKELEECEQIARQRLDQQKRDSDREWTERTKKEYAVLHQKLTRAYQEDRKVAIAVLEQQKEQEAISQRQDWEGKHSTLMKELQDLKKELETQSKEANDTLEAFRVQKETQFQELHDKMENTRRGHDSKLTQLAEEHRVQIERLKLSKDKEAKVLETRLREECNKEIQSQLLAHKSNMDLVRTQAEHARKSEIEMFRKAQQKETDKLKRDVEQKYINELEQCQKSHSVEVTKLKSEIRLLTDASDKKEYESNAKIGELQDELERRERLFTRLESEFSAVKVELNELKKEFELKGHEVTRIRSEANEQMRRREKELTRIQQEEMDELEAEHLRSRQAMLADFNRAQDSLKDKISRLKKMLLEAEEHYENRESRPEDIRDMNELRDAVHNKDKIIHRLLNDKKFYELELQNRETNFNKIFNSSPHVGYINPLASSSCTRKSKEMSPLRQQSMPVVLQNSSSRLKPLNPSATGDYLQPHYSQPSPSTKPPSIKKLYM